MPSIGQTVSNPHSGETITFVRTAAQTDGAAVELLFEVTPGGNAPARHVHPQQTETFEVHAGRARFVVAGVEQEVGPGATLQVEPGTPHVWSALTDLRMTVTLEPALSADRFFEDYCELAHSGGTDASGMPTPLNLAVLGDDHRDLAYLAGPPVWLQKTLFAALARIARRLGRGAPALRAAALRADAPAAAAPSPGA
jgi:quercetin dioxygenase-like cupin family protein